MLKYNFESNSQQSDGFMFSFNSWELYAKVQFWKQFTTANQKAFTLDSWELYAKVQFWKQFTTRPFGR